MKLPGHRPGPPGKVISLHIVPLDHAYEAGSRARSGHVLAMPTGCFRRHPQIRSSKARAPPMILLNRVSVKNWLWIGISKPMAARAIRILSRGPIIRNKYPTRAAPRKKQPNTAVAILTKMLPTEPIIKREGEKTNRKGTIKAMMPMRIQL